MYNIRAILWTNIRNENRNKPRVSQCYKLIIEFIFPCSYILCLYFILLIFFILSASRKVHIYMEKKHFKIYETMDKIIQNKLMPISFDFCI